MAKAIYLIVVLAATLVSGFLIIDFYQKNYPVKRKPTTTRVVREWRTA